MYDKCEDHLFSLSSKPHLTYNFFPSLDNCLINWVKLFVGLTLIAIIFVGFVFLRLTWQVITKRPLFSSVTFHLWKTFEILLTPLTQVKLHATFVQCWGPPPSIITKVICQQQSLFLYILTTRIFCFVFFFLYKRIN